MLINKLDAHDRLGYLHATQASEIEKGLQDCIDSRPEAFAERHFYIHVHKRTIELDERIALLQQDIKECLLNSNLKRRWFKLEDVPATRIIYMPRATRPACTSNSMLFRCFPKDMLIEPIWIIPEVELWDNFTKGQLTQDDFIQKCINQYKADKKFFEQRDSLDYSDAELAAIRREIGQEAHKTQREQQFKPI